MRLENVGDKFNMKNKKMLSKFEAFLACLCMFPQACVGLGSPSETRSKKYGFVDELKTSFKVDTPLWVAGGVLSAVVILTLFKTCTKSDSKDSQSVTNRETSQYRIDHSKINLESAEVDVIQGNLIVQICNLRQKIEEKIDTYKISNFVQENFTSIEEISKKITKYFEEKTSCDEKKQLISEIKNIVNGFSKTMVAKDKNWGWYYLDKYATDKDVLGVAVEVMFKYATRLIRIYDENYLLKKSKESNLNAQNILARLDSSQNFYDVYNLFQDYRINIDIACDTQHYAAFSQLSTMYKKLLEGGRVDFK